MATLYQSYADYILANATWSANVTPMATYDVTTLGYLRPDWRIKWATGTVTITATLSGALQGDIVAVPMSNLDAGSLTVTNNGGSGGVNQVIAIPAKSVGGWQPTAWFDLTQTWSVSQRTASVWNFVVTGNSVNLTIGAALWISGPKTTFDHGFTVNTAHDVPTYYGLHQTNEYGVDFVLDLGAKKRMMTGTFDAKESMSTAIMGWVDGCRGNNRPGLFVRDTLLNDALCPMYPAATIDAYRVAPHMDKIVVTLTELNKGIVPL
jgi:hypothetical protein